mgnify:CR=1 FL=1
MSAALTMTITVATTTYVDNNIMVINDLFTGDEVTLLNHSDIDIAVNPGALLVVDYNTEYVEDWETGEMVPQHTLVGCKDAL